MALETNTQQEFKTRESVPPWLASDQITSDFPKLNLGCGQTVAAGWINTDISPSARLAKFPRASALLKKLGFLRKNEVASGWNKDILIHDLRTRLPFSNASVSVIYSSHSLEHLYCDEAQELLRECYRVLKPGGVIRVVVPDLYSIARDYLLEFEHQTKSLGIEKILPGERFSSRLFAYEAKPHRSHPLLNFLRRSHNPHSHKWMYDEITCAKHLNEAGFNQVQRRGFRESRITEIDSIEQLERVANGEGLCLEAVKPLSEYSIY